MAERFNQHTQSLVGSDEPKKEVRHISIRKLQLPARFQASGAVGEVLVQRVKQGHGFPRLEFGTDRVAQGGHAVAGSEKPFGQCGFPRFSVVGVGVVHDGENLSDALTFGVLGHGCERWCQRRMPKRKKQHVHLVLFPKLPTDPFPGTWGDAVQ